MAQQSPSNANPFLGSEYKIIEKIGQGSFGSIYRTRNIRTKQECITKFEKAHKDESGLLYREIRVLQELKGIQGFPQLLYHGKDRRFSYCMMSYLGPNLEQLLKLCKGRLQMESVLSLGIQMVDLIEVFHSKSFIHRDIKPENYVVGREDISQLYMIDFGLAKYYRSDKGHHIEFVQKKGMIGTARYASINALQGLEQSRRDDLEAIGYVLVYLATGSLPWMNIQANTKQEKYQKILNQKMYYSTTQICKNLPKCFVQYFQHVKILLFQQQPNYSYLRHLFQESLDFHELHNPFLRYDWENLGELQKIEDQYEQPRAKVEHAEQTVEEEGRIWNLKHQDDSKFIQELKQKFDKNQPKTNQKKSHQNSSKMNNYDGSANVSFQQTKPNRNTFSIPFQVEPPRKDSKRSQRSHTIQQAPGKRRQSSFEEDIGNEDHPDFEQYFNCLKSRTQKLI